MDILILLKANIRKKKGTFISLVILMAIIVTSMTAIFSVQDNFSNALNHALEAADSGDIVAFIKPELLTDELRSDVESSPLVERVRYFDTLIGNGASVGDCSTNNNWFMMKLRDGIQLFNEKQNGFENDIPELKSGEIYLPLGCKTLLECNTGDTVSISLPDGIHDFTIIGFVQEPAQGSSSIGWKQVFISDSDFDSILAACAPLSGDNITVEAAMMMIYKAESCTLSDAKFQRQLNLDTKIITNAIGSLTMTQSIRYTGLLFEVLANILLVFVGFLFVIVLIVMSHSISTEIEMDYVNLGILKSQGFTRSRIRRIFVMQYLLAELIGMCIGSLAALPLERVLSNIMMAVTAILPDSGLSIGKSLLFIMLILLISLIIIFIKTEKVSRVSPVRAICGGREAIYFDSRLNTPVTKKALSASLALRQFTSGKKRYIGTIMIAAILTFFMLSVNLLGNLLTSRTALEAMGVNIADVDVRYLDTSAEEYVDDIEALVERYSAITKKYYMNSGYMSVNGENLRYDCYKYPEYIGGILKGRAPLYDNEIVITEMIEDTLDIHPGDEVTVANKDQEAVCIISGIYQVTNDSGMNFAMSLEAAKKLGVDSVYYMGFLLEDPSKNKEIADALNERFGDVITAEPYSIEEDGLGDDIELAVTALRTVIYIFSVLFALVVVSMVCSRTFIQERTDIGIYKAMGFTSNRLRLQFAVRFLVVALIGAALGTALSIAFSAKLIGGVLRMIGLSRVIMPVTFGTIFIPIVVVSVCFFVFAFMVSRKIRRVEVRELITE